MEVENETPAGSLVSLKGKPPGKGRKKKSAVAKLVEKKRRGSECGSEYGSTVSIQKENSKVSPETKTNIVHEANASKQKETQSSNPIKQEKASENIEHNTSGGDADTKLDSATDSGNRLSRGKEHDQGELSDNKEKESPPKPVPRKLDRRKIVDKNPFGSDGLESGTVVSIYEKRDPSPARHSKRDSSPTSRKVGSGSDSEVKSHSSRRELNFKKSETKDTKPETIGDIFSLVEPVKPKPRLTALGDLPALDGGSSLKSKNVELSPPVPMDLDHESDDDKNTNAKNTDVISKNAPSDATVHRFRAMRMTPDRSRSEESLKNAVFAPKPPSTPKSERRSSTKGEKRNRESNSSGEEAEVKKQNSVKAMDNIANTSLSNLQMADDTKMDVSESAAVGAGRSIEPVKKGLSLHPNLTEVKDITELNANQNMQEFEENRNNDNSHSIPNSGVKSHSSNMNKNSLFPCSTVSDDKIAMEVSTSDKGFTSDSDKKGKKSDKKKGGKKSKVKAKTELAPLDGSDTPGKSSIDTIGSASDLQAINEQYRQVLTSKDETPVKHKTGHIPTVFDSDSVLPEPKANAGKLDPIQPKSHPPPLPQDVQSSSLRTMYKTDSTNAMTKFFGRSFSGQLDKEKVSTSKFDALSARSLSASSALPVVSTREARDRMRHGNGGLTLLSSTELDRYFPDRKVGLWIGSWNMSEIKIKKDCKEPLDDFLLPEVSEYVQDIYAIGTQENAMSKKEWEILLQETIGTSHVLFHSASHGALHLAVFVKRDLIWFCTVPEDDLVQTRAVTMVKTKGAIAIGFQFFGTSLLFINCHFAPGDEKKKERLDDFAKIIKNLNLPKQGQMGSPNSNASDVTTRYDGVFWMGDLNFRIEVYKGKQAVEDIVKYIEAQEHKNFEDLVSGDQLSKLIVEGSIFQGFQEGRINFRPTYKYDIGQDTFDTSSKNRIPSYTDRVLFRAKRKNSITCTHYDSPRNVKLSDHKPVFAIFEVAVQPARDCNLPLAAGQFDRNVYTEANRRRNMKVEVIKTLQQEKSTKVCTIQ